MTNDYQYAYAVGRIRMAENRLLDKGRFERMIDSDSADESLRILVESGYSIDDEFSQADGNQGARGYDLFILSEKKKLYLYMKEILPEPSMLNIFLLENDYFNLKVLIKQEMLGQNHDSLLSDNGTISVKALKSLYNGRQLEELPPLMKNAIQECLDNYSELKDPRNIDMILDKCYFRHAAEMARTAKTRSVRDFLLEFISVKADLLNISIMLRIRKNKGNSDIFQRAFLPSGSLTADFFEKCFDFSWEDLIDYFKTTDYADIVDKGISDYMSNRSIVLFEKLSDDYLMHFIRGFKGNPFGVEPLLGYFYAKLIEMKNIGIVMIGKLNSMSADSIGERLRDLYV